MRYAFFHRSENPHAAYYNRTDCPSGTRRSRTLNEREDKLWDNVNFAYKTLESHHAQAGDPLWLENRYGPDLQRVLDLAESTVEESIKNAGEGRLSGTAAREEALGILRGMSYDDGAGFLWVSDTGIPIPGLLLYPVDAGKEGNIANDDFFSVAGKVDGGISDEGTEGLNLFAAARW